MWSLSFTFRDRAGRNLLNSMADTAVHTDSGTRSRKTKKQVLLSLKRLGGSVNCFTIMAPSSNCVIDHK